MQPVRHRKIRINQPMGGNFVKAKIYFIFKYHKSMHILKTPAESTDF
jgi:hypothetical protein